jgi:hypothetical protein
MPAYPVAVTVEPACEKLPTDPAPNPTYRDGVLTVPGAVST